MLGEVTMDEVIEALTDTMDEEVEASIEDNPDWEIDKYLK